MTNTYENKNGAYIIADVSVGDVNWEYTNNVTALAEKFSGQLQDSIADGLHDALTDGKITVKEFDNIVAQYSGNAREMLENGIDGDVFAPLDTQRLVHLMIGYDDAFLIVDKQPIRDWAFAKLDMSSNEQYVVFRRNQQINRTPLLITGYAQSIKEAMEMAANNTADFRDSDTEVYWLIVKASTENKELQLVQSLVCEKDPTNDKAQRRVWKTEAGGVKEGMPLKSSVYAKTELERD